MPYTPRAVIAKNAITGEIRRYRSINQATKEIGSGVQHCLEGRQSKVKDWAFEFETEANDDTIIIARNIDPKRKAVEIYSVVYGTPVRRFESAEEASLYLEAHYWVEVRPDVIMSAAKGHRKTAGKIKVYQAGQGLVETKLRWRLVPQDEAEGLSAVEFDRPPLGYVKGDWRRSTYRLHDTKPWKL